MRRFAVLAALLLAVGCSSDAGSDLLVGGTGTGVPPQNEDTTDAPDVEDVEEPDEIPDLVPDPGPEEETGPDVPDEGPDVPEVPPDTKPPDPVGPDLLVCDAGDAAWVKAVLPVLIGRRARGIREVRALVDLVSATDRATVARGLLNGPEYLARWQAWLMDELRVNRTGDKQHPECYGAPMQPNDDGAIAIAIRDNPALGSNVGVAFNMSDVLLSSLRIDDLSPFYRAHLFAMLARPITGANVAAIAMDITRRQDFGEIFEATYLHRNVVCAGCHNSKFGTTDSPDPEKDLHFPVPGLFERAIYGSDSGRPEMEVYSIWRHLGVVRETGGKRPWGMDAICGRFQNPISINDDPAKFTAFFIVELGLNASVWNTEESLHKGFDALRSNGGLTVDPETLAIDPYEGFATMVSMRIANRVWREIMGYPLTLVHYIPRNAAQRDILIELTEHFIVEQWSLRTLLVDVVTHPLFNDQAPIDGCAPETGNPYIFPPLFNPWVLEEELEEERNNSVGDVMHRYNARLLLSIVSNAMLWLEAPGFPGGAEASFQKAVGLFVKDSEPGFDGVDFQGLLTWESRYGDCIGTAAGSANPDSCVGACGEQASGGCWCDDQCAGFDDCCEDHEPVCIDGIVPDDIVAVDWVDVLATAVEKWQTDNPDLNLAVADVAASMKDRLLAEPDLDPVVEGGLIAGLFGVDNIATPLSDVEDWEAGVRRYCGVLLETPQFLLAGVPGPDQKTVPKVVVANETYLSHCQSLSTMILSATDYTVTCDTDSVTVVPIEPDKPETKP